MDIEPNTVKGSDSSLTPRLMLGVANGSSPKTSTISRARCDITFTDVRYTVRTKDGDDLEVLKGVSGRCGYGRLTAIMCVMLRWWP